MLPEQESRAVMPFLSLSAIAEPSSLSFEKIPADQTDTERDKDDRQRSIARLSCDLIKPRAA
jgi:hypothetical protein